MARYRTSITSAAALAANAGFFYMPSVASVGWLLRRITVGFTSNGAAVAASQQIGVGVAPITAAGTGAAAPTSIQTISPNGGTSAIAPTGPFATTQPTFSTSATAGNLLIPLNNQSAADLSWEEPDQWFVVGGTTAGLAFYASQVFPAGVSAALTVEWEI